MHTALPAAACVLGGLFVATMVAGDNISERARKLHFSSIVVDTHDDTTQRLLDDKFDLGVRHADGSIDIPRMREGNLSAISSLIVGSFFSASRNSWLRKPT